MKTTFLTKELITIVVISSLAMVATSYLQHTFLLKGWIVLVPYIILLIYVMLTYLSKNVLSVSFEYLFFKFFIMILSITFVAYATEIIIYSATKFMIAPFFAMIGISAFFSLVFAFVFSFIKNKNKQRI